MFYTKNEKGRYQPVNDNMILDKAKDIIYARMVRENSSYGMSSPSHMAEFLKVALTDPYETFAMVYLDNRHRVIAFEKVFRGTIDGSSVHPREVVRECLNKNAAAVVFAHNHPSGVADPSQADIRITQKLKDALNLIEVRVLDHIIIGGDNYYSLAEHSML